MATQYKGAYCSTVPGQHRPTKLIGDVCSVLRKCNRQCVFGSVNSLTVLWQRQCMCSTKTWGQKLRCNEHLSPPAMSVWFSPNRPKFYKQPNTSSNDTTAPLCCCLVDRDKIKRRTEGDHGAASVLAETMWSPDISALWMNNRGAGLNIPATWHVSRSGRHRPLRPWDAALTFVLWQQELTTLTGTMNYWCEASPQEGEQQRRGKLKPEVHREANWRSGVYLQN